MCSIKNRNTTKRFYNFEKFLDFFRGGCDNIIIKKSPRRFPNGGDAKEF